ncbi:MAG: hypothetical protein AAGF22_00440 [Pseudomonadota bacterium]
MSFFAFILRAYALSPSVFLRYLPALVIYMILVGAVVASTDNIWVIGLLGFLLSTFGVAFLVVAGIRGALMAGRLTSAPTAEGYMQVVPRLLFAHLLTQFLLAIILGAGVYVLVTTFFLPPEAREIVTALRGLYSASGEADPAILAEELAVLENNPELFATTLLALNVGMYLVFGICIGIFGVPMAALSANAVQYSPGNDLIYGITRYFPHQVVLYMLGTAAPVLAFNWYMPPEKITELVIGSTDPLAASMPIIAFGVYILYAPCISYAGMALGYAGVRENMARSRESERRPEVDYEAERENLRALRQTRKSAGTGATVYDPVAEARARRTRQ